MKPESRRKLIDRAWDGAAKQCAQRIKAEPNTKELRDLVYILEHLNDMLPPQQPAAENVGVIFLNGDPEWGQ